MCYLIAKRFDDKGCIAVKSEHGKNFPASHAKSKKKLDLMVYSLLQSAVQVLTGNINHIIY